MLESILVPLDGSPLAESVLPHVVALAGAFGSRVILLRVLEAHQNAETTLTVDPLSWQLDKSEAGLYLDSVRARLEQADLQVETALLEGRGAEHVVEFAESRKISLIVIGSHGQSGLSRWSIGSIAQKIVLSASTSLLIVRGRQPTPETVTSQQYERILVPLDGSWRAECVLSIALQLARAHQSQLHLASVVGRPELARRTPPTQEDLDLVNRLVERNQEETARYLEQLPARLPVEGLDVQTHLLLSENVTTTLYELVEQEHIDLLMLCAHGYSGEARWPYGRLVSNFILYGASPLFIMQDLPSEKTDLTQSEVAVRDQPGH